VSLVFPYKRYRVSRPLPWLQGRDERPRPTILVTLIGPRNTHVERALLNTGADDTLFPDWVAARLGIPLDSAPTGSGAGVGRQPLSIRYAEATLRVTDNNEQREWRGWVGFTSSPLNQPLLGYAGFLQYFTATFYGDREEVELTINGSYPGR
jgi:hypothetical protein